MVAEGRGLAGSVAAPPLAAADVSGETPTNGATDDVPGATDDGSPPIAPGSMPVGAGSTTGPCALGPNARQATAAPKSSSAASATPIVIACGIVLRGLSACALANVGGVAMGAETVKCGPV